MFSLPAIPTDNLYKFCFIGGILFVLFSMYLLDAAIETRAKTDIVFESGKIQMLMDSVSTVRKTIQDSIDGVVYYKGKTYTHESLKNYKLPPDHNPKLDSMIALQLRFSRSLKDFNSAKQHEVYAYSICIIGLLMLVFGWNNWNKHIQAPQDRLAAIQVEMACLDLESAKVKLNKLKNEDNEDANSTILTSPSSN